MFYVLTSSSKVISGRVQRCGNVQWQIHSSAPLRNQVADIIIWCCQSWSYAINGKRQARIHINLVNHWLDFPGFEHQTFHTGSLHSIHVATAPVADNLAVMPVGVDEISGKQQMFVSLHSSSMHT